MTLEEYTVYSDILKKMRLTAMANQLKSLTDPAYVSTHTIDEATIDMIMAEAQKRNNRKVARYLKEAGLRHNGAAFNDEMIRPGSGLTYETLEILKDQNWIAESQNILITGLTGTGKSYLASAIGAHAITHFYKVRYERMSLILNKVYMAELSGKLPEMIEEILDIDVLILDDFGMRKLDLNACRSLYEILETREKKLPTIIVSQTPISEWYYLFEDTRYADVCMDRLLNNALRIELKGDSLRSHGVQKRPNQTAVSGNVHAESDE